jgi:leucyl-tRNA synthetase
MSSASVDKSQNEKKTWKSAEFKEIEHQIQQQWKIHRTHQHETDLMNPNKFVATFPYPYMNGFLHLGHGFTMSKYDFACRYFRSMGYDVLEPFSFHLTGMPIMTAADKLKEDLKSIDQNELPETSQYKIMKNMGIHDSEIRNFTDPRYWGVYFPKIAIKTLERFGIGYDPKRTFVTTDANPIYDSFVKWQFTNLFRKNVLRFGTRYDLYSVKDSQPCLGHERSSGEDAVPQIQYLVQFKLKEFEYEENMNIQIPVYLIATSTRPETLCGATNIWVDKNISYGVFYVETTLGNEYWICQESNLIGLMHQNRETDKFYLKRHIECRQVSGKELIGSVCINTFTESIELTVLPLNYQSIDPSLKIDVGKGTGIWVSVPSESHIDYLGYCCTNLDNDSLYKITVPIVPIISVIHEDYTGTLMAVDLMNSMRNGKNKYPTVSQKDMAKIREFCNVTSLKSSTMNVGTYAGQGILDARIGIVDANPGIIPYYEPDQEAYSRSGDKLIVAKMDQWFIDYGDQKWKESAMAHLDTMRFTDPIVKNGLKGAIQWLNQWPCSRTYGLGSSFPEEIAGKDTVHKIDSLSDSTIYMALYTIYHLFERYDTHPSDLTHDVWDYIFLLKHSEDSKFDKFKPFRDEFMHWYPVDLRVSAKDLINNHLAMCIFNHVMIWDQEFMHRYTAEKITNIKSFGPVSYEINGYICVQKTQKIEKMSKSKGNFKTLDQAIDLYTTDSIRFTFASASKGTDDSYFDQDLCSRTIEKFYKEKLWICEKLDELAKEMYSRTEINFIDSVVMNEMLIVCRDTMKAYEKMDFQDVVTKGFHIFQGLRDTYQEMHSKDLTQMNPMVLKTFIRAQMIMMVPIIPHFCAFFDWMEIFHDVMGTVRDMAGFSLRMTDLIPLFSAQGFGDIDLIKHWQHKYLTCVSTQIAKRVLVLNKKKPVAKVTVFTAEEITDPMERLAHQIFRSDLMKIMPMDAKDIMMAGKLIDPLSMENEKNVGLMIRYYRGIEELIETYGIGFFDQITGKESKTLSENLGYYLKRNASDRYMVTIVDYMTGYHEKIPGVRINDPVIRYE